MIENKRILVLAPHTDDGELGCGGTISKLGTANTIFYAAFSTCAASVPPLFEPTVLQEEVKRATAVLGIKKENLIVFDYEVRRFSYQRQEILDDLLRLKKDISPDIVFMPAQNDIHQDHVTITNEGIRAFKASGLLCYELPWNNFSFSTSCFVSLQEAHVQAKCDALSAYQSQAHRPYTQPDFIRSLATVRGVQSGLALAEAFEVVRWML